VLEELMDHLDQDDFPAMLGRVRIHQQVLTAANRAGIDGKPDEGTNVQGATARPEG
jgi:hypothetical protein